MSDRDRHGLVVTIEGLVSEWSSGRPERWENDSVPRYVEALAAWLADSDGYNANQGRDVPEPWTVLADALKAAVVYE